ncbi:MAG: helix-turn-helix domain-containing protein [Polaromonas sp.]|uniref:helix-turn-helix domain-containing protein n=1 Tax=Polaromonas sp. TaxID=1869339 RepID=UPI0032631821
MSTIKVTDAQEDMHPADVVAALRKRGTSLRKIAIANGYSHIQRVLTSPWLAAEQLVAHALDKRPEELWPSRYLNPADRALAFQQTRKIKITMPHPAPRKPGHEPAMAAGGDDASTDGPSRSQPERP